jgi:hypothetical protein
MEVLHGTHRLLVFANINIFSRNINAIKKITKTLSDTSKEFSLEVNAEKTMYKVKTCQ